MRKCKNNCSDLLGRKFGMLTIIGFRLVETQNSQAWYWDCKCDCGNTVRARKPCNVRSGQTSSCGCLKKKVEKQKFIGKHKTHGKTDTRLYGIWSKMKGRCMCLSNRAYKNYGGRGIMVCDEWKNFEVFYEWAINNGYNDNLTIERNDVNGGYSPDNCCWIPLEEQAANKRNIRYVELDGVKMPLKTACNLLKIPYKAVHLRITRQGWDIERSLTEPIHH